MDKTYDLKLAIAKIAYKEIRAAIDKFEDNGLDICAHWDECISVDDELFHGHQLREGFVNKQMCRFCENPSSILTKETCCTGCSKLREDDGKKV